MEVIAVAEAEGRWRWEIWDDGRVVERSEHLFDTLRDALVDEERHIMTVWMSQARIPSIRRFQGRPSHKRAS
jgi:hypothetical protein